MATKAHSLVSVASRHPLPKYEYANAAARTGATGFVGADLNAMAHQQDNDTYWLLVDPAAGTWLQVVTGGATAFTAASVIYAGASGGLTDDGANFSYAAGIATLANGVTFTGSGTIATTGGGNLVLLPDTTGITVIGDAGSTSQGLIANDDLFVSGKVEVDGPAYHDDITVCTGYILSNNNIYTATGRLVGLGGATSPAAAILWNTSQTNDCPAIEVNASSNYLLVYQRGDGATNFGAPNYSNPTLRIQSADETNTAQHGTIQHDQTDLVINQGAGTTKLAGGVTHNVTTVNAATYDLLISDYLVHVTYTATGAVTSLTLPTAQTLAGRTIHIKDAGGNAATNNITIDTEGAQTIDGSATLVLNTDYAWVSLYCDGSDWFAIGG